MANEQTAAQSKHDAWKAGRSWVNTSHKRTGTPDASRTLLLSVLRKPGSTCACNGSMAIPRSRLTVRLLIACADSLPLWRWMWRLLV